MHTVNMWTVRLWAKAGTSLLRPNLKQLFIKPYCRNAFSCIESGGSCINPSSSRMEDYLGKHGFIVKTTQQQHKSVWQRISNNWYHWGTGQQFLKVLWRYWIPHVSTLILFLYQQIPYIVFCFTECKLSFIHLYPYIPIYHAVLLLLFCYHLLKSLKMLVL